MRRVAVLGMITVLVGGGVFACGVESGSSTIRVSGRVIATGEDSSGRFLRPVPGVQVVATTEETGGGEQPIIGWKNTTTDAQGRFQIDIPLSGSVDDPTNPTRITPVVNYALILNFEYATLSDIRCDTSRNPFALVKTYTKLEATKRIPGAQEDIDIGDVYFEEFSEAGQIDSVYLGGC